MYGKDRGGLGRAVAVESDGTLTGMSSKMSACLEGRLYSVCNQTPTNMSATLVEAYTGLAVGNPAGSGKLLVFHEFGYAFEGEVAEEGVLALATGSIGTLVAVNIPQNCLIGAGNNSVAVADETGPTLGTLTMNRIIAGVDDGSGALTLGSVGGPSVYKFDGSLVLMPGYAIVGDYTAAPGDTIQMHFLWEEIDE